MFVVITQNPVPSEYATSPIQLPARGHDPADGFRLVGDQKQGVDDTRFAAELNELGPETHRRPTSAPLFRDGSADGETFELELLDSPASPPLPIPLPKHEKSESVAITTAASPPGKWSWTWGGLPEKTKGDTWDKNSVVAASETMEKLSLNKDISKMKSVPILRSTFDSKTNAMSSQEKVNNYLSSLPNELQIAEPIVEMMMEDSAPAITPLQVAFEDSELHNTLEISVCGPLSDLASLSLLETGAHFKTHQITFEHFCEDPSLLMDPLTVYRFNGYYHTWTTAAPEIFCLMAFGKGLPESVQKSIIEQQIPVSAGGYTFMRGWFGKSNPTGKQSIAQPIGTDEFATSPPRNDSPTRFGSAAGSPPKAVQVRPTAQYAKSLRLTSDQLVLFI